MTHFDISINFRRLHTFKVLIEGESIRKEKMEERKREGESAKERKRDKERDRDIEREKRE